MPTTRPRRSARLVLLAAAATSVVLLAGCASPGTGGEGDGPRVVATTTQVADFTDELAGEQVELTPLLQPGQSAHAFDPSAAQLLALGQADALVVNGGGLESWLDDAIAASGFDGALIDASTGIELAGTDEVHDEAAQADEHGDEAHDDDDHAHGSGNPHIWTDPALAEQMVANIADGLADLDGVDIEALRARESDYTAQLAALDDWIAENVAAVPADQRLLVTNHDAFTYFLSAYDVTFVGSVIPSFDDNAEPSAAEIDRLVDRIRATGVRAVFSEASISPKAAATIAAEADVAVYSGDDALYGDSLGQPGSDGDTYLGSQLHNARLILESWGVEPSALPDALRG
ncbi:zinc/manganese transport system substrate-binding protein/manganese/iron transport system substrate-binding protein [Agromyces flavus]|uniref:Manganese/iron transport system substrate-binding protein n=1 Tax=Agromyces flavus TaxID=589382 RepID=A0A1H1Z0A9_9MICO|nr:metal ABC transporter substrate-binding protein [Agromyces flavus]MCP2366871.1 zinc/manganese transport system substrate-binding protein/manganese/iron transport system substrate-binding protein [Agromyces flavus]GGI46854.1 ABC transporter substrate-binding protein [Agromyces flavus]SDT27053.1 manganese/iron transport system substrate-binding protein [Agromyces flavus]